MDERKKGTDVCGHNSCPSRGSMWSGRQPHNVPHMHNGIAIRGAWNNYEGVSHAFVPFVVSPTLVVDCTYSLGRNSFTFAWDSTILFGSPVAKARHCIAGVCGGEGGLTSMWVQVGIGSTRPGVNEDDLMGPHLASAGSVASLPPPLPLN